MRPELHHVYNWDKKNNHSIPVATFSKNFKGLVPVGNRHFVAGEDIPDVPQDCVSCTYHLIFFRKIKKRFGLSKVSTLTPADASGPIVRSTNVRIHKIDGTTLKPLVWSRWKISSKRPVYFSKRRSLWSTKCWWRWKKKGLSYRRQGFIKFQLMFSFKA